MGKAGPDRNRILNNFGSILGGELPNPEGSRHIREYIGYSLQPLVARIYSGGLLPVLPAGKDRKKGLGIAASSLG